MREFAELFNDNVPDVLCVRDDGLDNRVAVAARPRSHARSFTTLLAGSVRLRLTTRRQPRIRCEGDAPTIGSFNRNGSTTLVGQVSDDIQMATASRP